MTLDLDRLHAVFSGELEGRCVGHTTLAMDAILQIIELTSKYDTVFLVTQFKDHAYNLEVDFKRKLNEAGYFFYVYLNDTILLPHNIKIRFVCVKDFHIQTDDYELAVKIGARGVRNYWVVTDDSTDDTILHTPSIQKHHRFTTCGTFVHDVLQPVKLTQ